jgi:hypothetical protein
MDRKDEADDRQRDVGGAVHEVQVRPHGVQPEEAEGERVELWLREEATLRACHRRDGLGACLSKAQIADRARYADAATP